MTRPVLLDLFCGAGGAAMGYHRAGFDVIGVDVEPHPKYPFQLIVGDALDVLDRMVAGGTREWIGRGVIAAIHASPPCQAKTTMSNRHRGKGGRADSHLDYIAAVRWKLAHLGKPYVIENVPGARRDLYNPITLSGGMFGLGVERPRLFESNVPLTAPRYVKVVDPIGVYGKAPDGRRLFTRKDGTIQRAARSLEEGREAMGVGWMTRWEDVTEAIPPAYTEHIGRQLLAHIGQEAA